MERAKCSTEIHMLKKPSIIIGEGVLAVAFTLWLGGETPPNFANESSEQRKPDNTEIIEMPSTFQKFTASRPKQTEKEAKAEIYREKNGSEKPRHLGKQPHRENSDGKRFP
ncbi:MAG: hypothetical protein M2R45_00244 [Verrucomicrobia subdivision 3 bacterium]|nr:hypothetical protein [Limisphaerales bacterium]MCS1412997.1 hypothetical protein [Limisphaerales bacterium]